MRDEVAKVSSQTRREEVRAALGNPQEEVYRQPLEDRARALVEGTGRWLRRDPQFRAWADWRQATNSILGISARHGYGKSCLMANVINELRQRRPDTCADDYTRMSVAYYFFDRDVKAALKGQARDSLAYAIKTLAWQIVQEDVVYQKELASKLDSIKGAANDVTQLWTKLFLDVKTESTFYIILDGVDQVEERQKKLLSELVKSLKTPTKPFPRIRLLFSTTPAAFEIMCKRMGSLVPCIDIARRNKTDVKKFITNRLREMPIFRDPSDQIRDLKADALNTLADNAGGDFVNVGALLAEIGSKQWPSEVRAVLVDAKSDSGRAGTIARKIEDANRSLSPYELRDLNTLLLYVLGSEVWLSVRELKTILFLTNGQMSLRPLSLQIEQQYSAFLMIEKDAATVEGEGDWDKVFPASDLIKQYFERQGEETPSNDADSETAITKSEIQLVKRFLRTICDEQLFNKFGFEEFFERKLNAPTSTISVDLKTAPLELASTCARVLCMEDSGEAQHLYIYATNYLSAHLGAVDLSTVDRRRKVEIGKQLVSIFTDDEVIDRWWHWQDADEDVLEDLIGDWLQEDELPGNVLKWFHDPAVRSDLTEEHKDWIEGLLEPSPSVKEDLGKGDLLFFVVKHQADEWLAKGSWEIPHAYWACFDFIHAAGRRDQPEAKQKRVRNPVLAESVSLDEITGVIEWAALVLEDSVRDSNWVHNAAQTYQHFKHHDKAEELYREAIALAEEEQDDPYETFVGLGRSLASRQNYSAAIATLEPVLETVRGSPRKRKVRLVECLSFLGDWYAGDRQTDKAIQCYKEELDLTRKTDMAGAADIVGLLGRQRKWTEIIQFMKDTGSRLPRMYHKLAGDCDFHEWVQIASQRTESLGLVRNGYLKAIATAPESSGGDDDTSGVKELLEFHLATLLYDDPRNSADMIHAIETWKLLAQVDVEISRFKQIARVQEWSRDMLMDCFYDRFEATGDRRHLDALEALIPSRENTEPLVARCYAKYLEDKPRARRLLRPWARDGFELLSDNDLGNDWQGFDNIARALLFSQDEENAAAAFARVGIAWKEDVPAVVAPPERMASPEVDEATEIADSLAAAEAGQEGTSIPDGQAAENPNTPKGVSADSQQSLEAELSQDGMTPPSGQWVPDELVPLIECNGCSRAWTRLEANEVCRHCWDLHFCSRCADARRRGEFDRRRCHPRHEMLVVSPFRKGDMAAVGKHEILVGETVMPLKRWLEDLRKGWGVSERKSKDEDDSSSQESTEAEDPDDDSSNDEDDSDWEDENDSNEDEDETDDLDSHSEEYESNDDDDPDELDETSTQDPESSQGRPATDGPGSKDAERGKVS